MKYLVLLLLITLIPALVWSHPQIYPTDKETKMQATRTGEWQISSFTEEGETFYNVVAPDVSGSYILSFDGSMSVQALLQFNTNIGASADISSVTLSRTVSGSGGNFDYYMGTWATTPPAADGATFNGGTYAGGETMAEITDTIDLDTSLINKTGITSLRINRYGGFFNTTMSNVILTILYTDTTPAPKKLPFVAMP